MHRHAAYCAGIQRCLAPLGFATQFERVPVTIVDGDWRGWEKKGLRYWHFLQYWLPTCTLHVQDAAAEKAVAAGGASDSASASTSDGRKRRRSERVAPSAAEDEGAAALGASVASGGAGHPAEGGGAPWSELVRAADLEPTWMKGGIARALAAHSAEAEAGASSNF